VALTAAVQAQLVGRHFVRRNNKNFGHQERRIVRVGMARIGRVVARDTVVRKHDVVSEVSSLQ
jgi:hypothetical protein